MQDEAFSLNLVLKYVNHLKFVYEALNWTTDCSELDHNEPNHGWHHQIVT